MDVRRFGRWIAVVVCFWLAITAATSVAQELKSDLPPWCSYTPPASNARDLRIVLLAGDEEYRSEELMPMLGQLLSQRHGFHCTVLFSTNPESGLIDPNCQTNVPGMEALQQADLVIMGWRFRNLPDEQMKYFVEYLESGKPLIALRTSTHAFRYAGDSTSPYARYRFDDGKWKGGFGKQVLGETWVAHHGAHGREGTRGIIRPDMAQHPLLRGVNNVWGDTDVYTVGELPAGTKVLLDGQVVDGMKPDAEPVTGAKNEPMMPVAWIREHQHDNGKRSQIFCTTMGAATDFVEPGLRRLVVNAAYWMTGLESEIKPDLNIEFVAPFQPTPFGFDKFQRGLSARTFDLAK